MKAHEEDDNVLYVHNLNFIIFSNQDCELQRVHVIQAGYYKLLDTFSTSPLANLKSVSKEFLISISSLTHSLVLITVVFCAAFS